MLLTPQITLHRRGIFVALWLRQGPATHFSQQDPGMDATADRATTTPSATYSSRPGALVWSFRKSRDGWKRKYQELKAQVKAYKNQIAAVTKSRQQWRAQAEGTHEQLATLQAENAALRTRIEAFEKKTTRGPAR